MRSDHVLHRCWSRLGFLAAALLFAGSLDQASADDAKRAEAHTDLASCQVSARAGCQCSLATLETPLTFSEAAGVISIFYQNFPDERYSRLLDDLLRQCAGEMTPASPRRTAPMQGSGTAPHSPIFARPVSVPKGGRP